jgi:hypothetical protein
MAGRNGIHDSTTTMKAAFRVLAAVTYGRHVSPGDLDMLRYYAPDLATQALDDFARETIQRISLAGARALERRPDSLNEDINLQLRLSATRKSLRQSSAD